MGVPVSSSLEDSDSMKTVGRKKEMQASRNRYMFQAQMASTKKYI